MKLEVGDEIVGRYRIEGRLGVGGMSTVMLAVDQRLERKVALKLLAEHLADDSTFVSRFRREALAAARLVHPNIVQVFDFGFDRESHQHFIVMEYVPGRSCAQVLRDHGRLEVDEAVDIVVQACNGLDYAHRHGVVHRDVKPGNLMVSETGVVKLADFGIARATGQSAITQIGSVLGTAAYLSPEQARGEEAGPYADLYALGVVTYQLLSGRLPYEANSLSELALKQQRELPVPLAELNRDVPRALSDAVALAISVVPTDRPIGAMALAESIERGARGIPPIRGHGRLADRDDDTSATRVLDPFDDPTGETLIAPARGGSSRAANSPGRTPPPRSEPRAPLAAPVNRPVPSAARRSGDGAINSRRGEFDAEPAPRGQYERPSRGRHRAGRRVAMLFGLLALFVLAVLVAVVIDSSSSGTVVHYRQIVVHDVHSGISQLRSMVDQYTSK